MKSCCELFRFVALCVLLQSRQHEVVSLTSEELSRSQLVLNDTGVYHNLLVFINHSPRAVPDEDLYINTIKEHIAGLSKELHQTLRLQMGNVTLLLPSTWGVAANGFARSSLPENADILVQEGVAPDIYTQHVLGCGKQALYMHIDKSFLEKSTSDFKSRLLLHEWFHTRYGVFDEHPVGQANIDSPKFYSSSAGNVEAVRCSENIEFTTECKITSDEEYKDIEKLTSLPREGCTFMLKNPSGSTPSLMNTYSLMNVDTICNDSNHNSEAPNRQNRICRGQSVRNVTENHKDFSTLNQTALDQVQYSEPTFRILKLRPTSRTVAFILDVSPSMNQTNRLGQAQQVIKSMLTDVLEDYVNVLIVTFAETARILLPDPAKDTSETFVLDSKEAREQAASSLDNITTHPYTCIGCGLELAYKRLSNASRLNGAFFIVLTDGAENKDLSKLSYMFNRSREENFIIDSIVINSQDYKDSTLLFHAQRTQSNLYFVDENHGSFLDAFTGIIAARQNASTQIVQIYSKQTSLLNKGSSISGGFIVDQQYSDSTRFSVFWSSSGIENTTLTVIVERSDGYVIVKEEITPSSGKVWSVDLPPPSSNIASLPYKYRIISQTNNNVRVTVTVNGNVNRYNAKDLQLRRRRETHTADQYKAANIQIYLKGQENMTLYKDSQPLTSIHALIPLGSTPAKPTSVVAAVTFTSFSTGTTEEFQIPLLDSGNTAADVIGNDNVYSAYFAGIMMENGTYQTRVQVEGEGFMRYGSTSAFSIYISNEVSNLSSILPPAPVVDLSCTEIKQGQITLQFTTSGADYDVGKASYYIMKFADTTTDLRDASQKLIQKIVNTTQPAGEVVTLEIDVPKPYNTMNVTFWVALTVVDNYGLESNISNLVSVMYISLDFDTDEVDKDDKLTLIVSLVLAALFLLMLLIFLIFCCLRKRKKKNKKTEEEDFSSPPPRTDDVSLYGDSYLPNQDTISSPDQGYYTYRHNPLPKTSQIKTKKSLNSIKRSMQSNSANHPQPSKGFTCVIQINEEDTQQKPATKPLKEDKSDSKRQVATITPIRRKEQPEQLQNGEFSRDEKMEKDLVIGERVAGAMLLNQSLTLTNNISS